MSSSSSKNKWINFLRQEVAPHAFMGIKSPKPSVVMLDVLYWAKRCQATTLGQCITHFDSLCKQFLVHADSAATVRVLILVVGWPDHNGEDLPKMTPMPTIFSGSNSNDMTLLPAGCLQNIKALRRFILPALFNHFMTKFQPVRGKALILAGFPGQMEWRPCGRDDGLWFLAQVFDMRSNEGGGSIRSVEVVKLWQRLPILRSEERDDPDLYHRVFIVETVGDGSVHIPPGTPIYREWRDARFQYSFSNSNPYTSSVHMRMLFLTHFYVDERIMFMTDDEHSEDMVAASLMYAYERIAHIGLDGVTITFRADCVGGGNGVALPPSSFLIALPVSRFVDMDALYRAVCSYEPFCEARVMNHEVLAVLLMLCDTSQLFLQHLNKFRCMAMLSRALPPDTRGTEDRRVVIDEHLLLIFLQIATSDTDTNRMRCKAREMEWKLNYLKQTPLGTIYVDPYEKSGGSSNYYPFGKDDNGKHIRLDTVDPAPRVIEDNVYAKNLFATFEMLNGKKLASAKKKIKTSTLP